MLSQKSLSLSLVILMTGVLVGCSHQSKPDPSLESTAATGVGETLDAADKQGTTSKTGLITESAGRFFLTEAGQAPQDIDSYAVELANYVGQTVTVTGQYSGNTLFVGQVN